MTMQKNFSFCFASFVKLPEKGSCLGTIIVPDRPFFNFLKVSSSQILWVIAFSVEYLLIFGYIISYGYILLAFISFFCKSECQFSNLFFGKTENLMFYSLSTKFCIMMFCWKTFPLWWVPFWFESDLLSIRPTVASLTRLCTTA